MGKLASLRSCVGTFIAVDHLLNQCTALDGIPNIDEVVRQMRLARNYMIQTEMQFVFVYRTLLDALTTLLEVENAKVGPWCEVQKSSICHFVCSFSFDW